MQNVQDRQSTPFDGIEDAFNFTQASGQEGGTSSGAVLAQPSQKCCYNHTLFHHPVVAGKEVGLPSRKWHELFTHLWTCLFHHLAMPGHRYICTSPDGHQSFWNGDALAYPIARES